MIWLILILTVATVATIAFVMAPRMAEGQVVFDTTPDQPRPFGYRMSWIAVTSSPSGI